MTLFEEVFNKYISQEEFDTLTACEISNLSLLYEVGDDNSSFSKIPLNFDFSEENIQKVFGSRNFSNRFQLVAFYLDLCMPYLKLFPEFAKKILLVAIRTLTGLRLDILVLPELNLLVSPPVRVLVFVYRFISVWELMKKPVSFDLEEFLETFVLFRSAKEMAEIEKSTHFFQFSNFPDFASICDNCDSPAFMDLLTKFAAMPTPIIEKFLVAKLSVAARSKREKLRARALRDKAISMLAFPELLTCAESSIWALPIPLGKDGIARNFQNEKIHLIETFFAYKHLQTDFLTEIDTNWAGKSVANREVLWRQIVRSGLKQWLCPGDISPTLITAKGTANWWNSLKKNSEKLEIPATIMKELLAFLLPKNHFGLQLVDTETVANVLHSFGSVDELLLSEIMFSGEFEVSEIEIIGLFSKFSGTHFRSDLVFHHQLAQLVKQIIETTLTSLKFDIKSFIPKKKLYFFNSIEYSELTNPYLLQRLRPTQIFAKMYICNSYSFLETEKIQKLVSMLKVSPDEYAHVLHYAGLAYCDCGEWDGAKSILNRLILEYKYFDSWRLAHRLGGTETMSEAVALCSENQLTHVLDLIAPERHISRSHFISSNDYLDCFPDLTNTREVDKYMHLIGDNQDVSFEMAEFISRFPSLTSLDPATRSGLHKAAMISI